jgi:hypothetical protein
MFVACELIASVPLLKMPPPSFCTNSTFSGNSAQDDGGGITNVATLTINNSTISGNSTLGNRAGGINNDGGTTTLQNSIVASDSGGNCFGRMTSNGYNLSSDRTCNFNGTGDLNNTQAKLGQLGNYGGPTQTIPLLSGRHPGPSPHFTSLSAVERRPLVVSGGLPPEARHS